MMLRDISRKPTESVREKDSWEEWEEHLKIVVINFLFNIKTLATTFTGGGGYYMNRIQCKFK